MEYDKFTGINRRAERMAMKIVGGMLTLFFVLLVSGLLKLYN